MDSITTTTRLLPSVIHTNEIYVVPALKKIPSSECVKTVVHIGSFNDKGKPICLCSQQEKDTPRGSNDSVIDDSLWQIPDEDKYPSITCRACLRTLNLYRDSDGKISAETVAKALGKKVEDMKVYVSPPSSYMKDKPNYSAEAQPFARKLRTGFILYAITNDLLDLYSTVHVSTRDCHGNIRPMCEHEANIPHSATNEWKFCDYIKRPSITCPKCAEIMRKRRLDEEPKRGKSLNMRKELIRKEQERLTRWLSWFLDLTDEQSQEVFGSPEGMKKALEDFSQSRKNLKDLKSGILWTE